MVGLKYTKHLPEALNPRARSLYLKVTSGRHYLTTLFKLAPPSLHILYAPSLRYYSNVTYCVFLFFFLIVCLSRAPPPLHNVNSMWAGFLFYSSVDPRIHNRAWHITGA